VARRNPLDLNVEDSPTTNKQVLHFTKSVSSRTNEKEREREREREGECTISDFLLWSMIAHRLRRSRFERSELGEE
jgi:hypothetical protein